MKKAFHGEVRFIETSTGTFSARVRPRLTKKKLAVGLALFAAGCASQPQDIAATYVSPVQYET